MTTTAALTGILAAVLALVHLFAGRLRLLDVVPRSRWLSAAGGIAVAYVFMHLLPELAAHQAELARSLAQEPARAESWLYLAALAGLATFYALERAVKVSRSRSHARAGVDRAELPIFWLHVGSFAAYNALIGYLLLHREETGLRSLAAYFVAMALHFVTSDFGLRQDHKQRYDGVARWMLAASVLAGWALGLAVEIPRHGVGFLFAFLAGGVVLNVLKEELPEERQSRLWPFAIGAASYAALVLAA